MIRKFAGVGTAAAPWLTAMDLPAIVSVTDRASPPFTKTVKVRLPDPVRVPDGMVIHEGTPVADQEHVELVETESVLVVPAAAAVTVPGVTVKVQFPGCAIVNGRPAIVTVAVRWLVPVLEDTLMVTVPLPDPFAPAVTASHDEDSVAVQEQPLCAVTATVVVSPPRGEVLSVGLMEYKQLVVAPACVIVTVCPATVSVPVRWVAPVLAVARKATAPVPVTGVPEVIDSQLLFAEAVQTQVVPAVTVIDPVDTADAIDADVADSTGVHGAATPACVMVTVCPATVSVPVRCVLAVLAVAANVTELDPVTGVDDVIDSQLAFAVAVHPQVVPAVTVIVPVEALDDSIAEPADSAGAHGAELANVFDRVLAVDPPGPTAFARA
jgi:hypothetical protein